jgi:hypothetical protein
LQAEGSRYTPSLLAKAYCAYNFLLVSYYHIVYLFF